MAEDHAVPEMLVPERTIKIPLPLPVTSKFFWVVFFLTTSTGGVMAYP
jgi:hypothetical protein